MKNTYKKKVWWNWWHLIVIILGLLLWFLFLGSICMGSFIDEDGKVHQIPFFECLIYSLKQPTFLYYTLFGIAILYLITTLISWLYYRNKK